MTATITEAPKRRLPTLRRKKKAPSAPASRRLSLGELKAVVEGEHRLACRAAGEVLEHMIKAGEALLEIKSSLAREETWTGWIDANLSVSRTSVHRYTRFAVYQDLIRAQHAQTADEAIQVVRGLKTLTGTAYHPSLKERAIDLRGQGLFQSDIAAKLGVSTSIIGLWTSAQSQATHKEYVRAQGERRRAAREASKMRGAEIVARKGGERLKAWKALDRARVALDAAIEQTKDADQKQALVTALARLHATKTLLAKSCR